VQLQLAPEFPDTFVACALQFSGFVQVRKQSGYISYPTAQPLHVTFSNRVGQTEQFLEIHWSLQLHVHPSRELPLTFAA
jgi:hypothetical protein